MTTRRDFLNQTAAVAGGLMLAHGVAHAKTPAIKDQLTDDTGKYVLLPLPYAYAALEPVIDARTVELHYQFHHKPAVAAANKAEEALAKARDSGDFSLVKHYEKELAFNLSSHILHTLYWTSLRPGIAAPKGELLSAIEKDFGAYDKFKAHLAAAATAVEASGWAVLAYHPLTGKLMILQCENHQKLTAWGVMPVLVLDVWEHAYYLKYQNRRAEYVNNLIGIIDWESVAARYVAARA